MEIGRLRAIQGRDAQYEIGFLLGCAFVAFPRLLCELFESTEDECSLDQGVFLTGLAVGMCSGVAGFQHFRISNFDSAKLGATFARACSRNANPDLKNVEDDAIGKSIAEAKKLLRGQFFVSFHDGMVEERRKMSQPQKRFLNSGVGGAMNLQIFHKFLHPTSDQIFEVLS